MYHNNQCILIWNLLSLSRFGTISPVTWRKISSFLKNFLKKLINFWLCWVFVAAQRLFTAVASLVVEHALVVL